MADVRIKTIKIKTGVVKRLAKEKVMYEKDAESQRNRVQKYKDEGKDDHDVRKQEEVLQECLMMVPDCQRRLVKAYEELQKIIDTETDLNTNEDYLSAVKVLEDAKLQLPGPGQALQHFC
ncbi:tubulin-specific chaperone A isoform X1 [Homalodisca vitripennis]|uniref:tubulin-specific chaperone A isoform X1 n=1 Tax=Homalodisca vitripennis TaxID=197043 RepID=UPI001EEA85E5|nr:tubulin-specific chaperone A isoform X1 [Homalodisca vitripennis]